MTENRLRDLLHQATPDQGPALQGTEVLKGARLRTLRRRQAVGAAAVTVLVVAGAAFAAGSGPRTSTPSEPAPTPCASPFDPAQFPVEQTVAFRAGETLSVTLTVGDHVSVGWAQCNDYGEIKPSDTGDESSVLAVSDSEGHTKPAPVPTGRPGFLRPEVDGTILVRFVAQRPGDVTLHGTSHDGAEGDIAVHVDDLPASESALVSGSIDSSGLTAHEPPSTVSFEPQPYAGSVVANPSGGRFSARLRPGRYHVVAFGPSYGDGRVTCTQLSIDVGTADLDGLKVTCTER